MIDNPGPQLPSPVAFPAETPGIPDDVALVAAKLDAIEMAIRALGSQRDEPAANIRVFLADQPKTWSVRTRVRLIRLVSDASATVTLQIGTASYLLRVRVDADNIYELPFIIEPGQDVLFTGPASPNFRAYVVAFPEPERPIT